jgi:hypothetical protein
LSISNCDPSLTKWRQAMYVVFALLVWAPTILAAPGKYGDWSEGATTLVLIEVAWMVARALAQTKY